MKNYLFIGIEFRNLLLFFEVMVSEKKLKIKVQIEIKVELDVFSINFYVLTFCNICVHVFYNHG
jgi:hypothetical protein